MGRKNYQIVILFLLLCCCLSCVKDKPETISKFPSAYAENIYIVCEGLLGNGDATLYDYQPTNDSVFGDVYSAVNNHTLGDIFESMTPIDDKLFLCINNSDKIIVVDTVHWQQVGSINIPKPRNILYVNAHKAYVSTLFSNKVYIIDPQSLQVTGKISMPYQNPEGMLMFQNTAYITTWDTLSDKLYAIDINTDAIIDSIQLVGYAPQEVLVDREQKLWVLSGNSPEGRAATFTRIDPFSNTVINQYNFPAAVNPMRPAFNKYKDSIYFIEANYSGAVQNNGIYRMPIGATTLPQDAFIQAKQYQYFYALGIDPVTDNIYVGDPKGFTQKGSVAIYKPDGSMIKQFNVGIGPGHFLFDRK